MRSLRHLPMAAALAAGLLTSLPAAAICWGDLIVNSSRTIRSNVCPVPQVTRSWTISCYDACGYRTDFFSLATTGVGQCFQGTSCDRGVICPPAVGIDIRRYSPPSLTGSTINRQGYYRSPPCNSPRCRAAGVNTAIAYCDCFPYIDPYTCGINDPLIVSLRDSSYRLTTRPDGVTFDLSRGGTPRQIPWSAAGSDEGFLALDRNGNGTIDNGAELFGDASPQHKSADLNGFRALELFDDTLSGGNEDRKISTADAVFGDLLIWHDANHNGFSEPAELLTLAEAGLESISLDYRKSDTRDIYGNEFRYFSESSWENGRKLIVWDVFLLAD